ncbi:DUF4270 domain-containing protein [Winogradskyella sp.]|nr:DUF4270 domain-containing protein [Winogradskyella sp.]MDA8874701.1 DUF4270 domain-containing protein [Winogradskyella sp.]
MINDDTATNFNTTSEKFDVISYNKPLNPIQTNNLGLNMLGVYDDPTYGRTVASLLTQVNTSLLDPSFGDNVILDSVVLTIPFFSRNVGVIDETFIDYEIDSVLPRGESYNPIKLSIFENTYFLRDFNPNDDFDSDQAYFSNKSASITEQIGALDLESVLIDEIESLTISNQEIILTDGADTDAVITERLSPRIRLVWDKDVAEDDAVISYWTNKIIAQEGLSTLSNPNNFNDYFRGLYFKAEPESMSDNGSLMLLNLSQQESNITLYYSFDSPTQESERDQSTYLLTFSPTRVNFFENDFTTLIPTGDEVNGDDRLFLKGGEGSLAGIKLFDGLNPDDDDTTDNTFEAWRKQYVILNDLGEFESYRRLINEANLIFYVDQDQVMGEEPDRLYLYNRANGVPLLDYIQDSQNNSVPLLSIPNHLGILEREDTDEGKGIRYKMKITSHVNSLLLDNAENVQLGIAVSGNVNLEATVPQYIEQTGTDEESTVPVSSIITPRGTILHGSNSEDITKRLYLEIFYTCLETDIDCPNN